MEAARHTAMQGAAEHQGCSRLPDCCALSARAAGEDMRRGGKHAWQLLQTGCSDVLVLGASCSAEVLEGLLLLLCDPPAWLSQPAEGAREAAGAREQGGWGAAAEEIRPPGLDPHACLLCQGYHAAAAAAAAVAAASLAVVACLVQVACSPLWAHLCPHQP
eukprot:scaffold94559_cov21-Tisochrysis_lutea.AAC.1